MLIRALFFALPALAIATSGYAQVPATSEPSAPPANPPPIRSSRKLVPAQSVAAAKTPVGTPSESPSPPATVAPPERKAGPGGQPVPDQDAVSRILYYETDEEAKQDVAGEAELIIAKQRNGRSPE